METCAGYVLLYSYHVLSGSREVLTKLHFPPLYRMKGPSYEQGTRLQASAGLHHLMANHWHVLVRETPFHTWTLSQGARLPDLFQSETLDKQFEKPLRQHLDTYRVIVNVSPLSPHLLLYRTSARYRSARTNYLQYHKERSSSYERALREKSHIIRETEMRNMNRKERSKPGTPVR